MNTINNFADDIFTIMRRKPVRKARQYRATWPCGSTWEFDRHDLEIPDFHEGEQNGVTFCLRTISEAKANLLAHGCTVEAI